MRDQSWLLTGLVVLCAASAPGWAADAADAKKLYDGKCASCHGKAGQGNPAMAKMFKLPEGALSLVSQEALAKPDADFVKTSEAGKGKMPSFKDKVPAAELFALAAYVRSLAAPAGAKSAAAKDPAQGLYAAKCASCHGKDGKGNAALAKALKVEPASLSLTAPETGAKTDAELLTVMKKGAGKMPGYDGKLSAAELADLLRYSRSLAPKKAEPAPEKAKP